MSNNRFSDRLDPRSYEKDLMVGVYEAEPDEEDSVWISERLFRRLTQVASAYELHTLPMLGGTDPVPLNRVRCEDLLDEVAFVAERLNDPLAVEVAQLLTNYLTRRTWNPRWDGSVTFEGN
ncbi:hypothetical protein GCM10028777_02610 [Angustibacter speluncae]